MTLRLILVVIVFCFAQQAISETDGSMQGSVSGPQDSTSDRFDAIRQRVLERCGLSADISADRVPWYFHYELAVELHNAGLHDKALHLLRQSTARREMPKRNSRMYGMWFVDYLPYFQMASTHAKLGNWSCAAVALQRSEQTVQFSQRHRQYDQYRLLRQRIQLHLGNTTISQLNGASCGLA